MTSVSAMKSMWEVFLLFAVPIGGGIPAGVLLARSRGLSIATMAFLYFVSDVVLACVFEPIMILISRSGKKSEKWTRVLDAFRKATHQTISRYGVSPGPWTLVMIAFGVDPMTGRVATAMQGHGFLAGWTIAILGDMIFFTVIMISTLWLNNILGDGTWTAIIIMAAMMIIPGMIRKARERYSNGSKIIER